MSVAALVPAAGSGTRLGLGPKAFVRVGGRTLLERSVRALAPHVDEVLVALPEGLACPVEGVRAIPGGATRQETVRSLLAATDARIVLVHDAARPFLPADVVRRVLDAVNESGAATAALKVADTLVRGRDGAYGELVPRDDTWAIQTPQGFVRDLLVEAHEAAWRAGWAATDDAGLVTRGGHTVRLVEGDARLLKVTTASDLALAEVLAGAWDATFARETV